MNGHQNKKDVEKRDFLAVLLQKRHENGRRRCESAENEICGGMKSSSSEPNVCLRNCTQWKNHGGSSGSVNNGTISPNNPRQNRNRNSKSEDCLLQLDLSDNHTNTSPKKTSPLSQQKNQLDDIFARALNERLGLKTDVPNPGRVMVLNETGNREETMLAPGGGPGDGSGLIAPRRLINPCLENSSRQDLHRELLFNKKIGKNVLNQKSELERALSKHKEKQLINQEKIQKETPEFERAIAERARRLEESVSNKNNVDKLEQAACNPQYIEARARLRHAK